MRFYLAKIDQAGGSETFFNNVWPNKNLANFNAANQAINTRLKSSHKTLLYGSLVSKLNKYRSS